jgi:hypothetical protein
MTAEGRKDNAEAQRTRSFAESEREARLPQGSADFAQEWEGDSDGGLGTSCLPFYVAAKWRCAPVLPRTCGGGELRRVVPSRSEVDRSAPADSPPSMRRARLAARESRTDYQAGRG